jgi:hypothetical protein
MSSLKTPKVLGLRSIEVIKSITKGHFSQKVGGLVMQSEKQFSEYQASNHRINKNSGFTGQH